MKKKSNLAFLEEALGSAFIGIIFVILLLLPSFISAKEFFAVTVQDLQYYLNEASNNKEDDKIYVAPGIFKIFSEPLYYEGFCPPTDEKGENHKLEIIGSGKGMTILDGGGKNYILALSSCFRHWAAARCKDDNTHFIIKSITFRNGYFLGPASQPEPAVLVWAYFGNITLEDCEFEDNMTGGVELNTSEGDIEVKKNVFKGGNYGGIEASSVTGKVTVTENSFENINTSGTQDYAADLSTNSGVIMVNSNKFDGNWGGLNAFSFEGKIDIRNNTIINNRTAHSRPVMIKASKGSSIYIFGNTFETNNGSGLNMETYDTSATIANNIFYGNEGGLGTFGGGIYTKSYGGSVNLYANSFYNNRAALGGAINSEIYPSIYTSLGGTFIAVNNIIAQNEFSSEGGGMYLENHLGTIHLTNNTIVSNFWKGNPPSTAAGGGVYIKLSDNNSSAEIHNNIIWGNRIEGNEADAYGIDIFLDDDGNKDKVGSSGNITHNNFADLYLVNGSRVFVSSNINSNPLLNDTYHLKAGSPCIDAGSNSAPSIPEKDFDGAQRIIDGNSDDIKTVDMGADEYQGPGIFADVSESHWAVDYINAIYEAGITRGCSEDPLMFCPDQNVTREQMAAFIVRTLYGESFLYSSSPYFYDVMPGMWSFKYVQEMYENNLTKGCGGGNYCPSDFVTRAQMAVFLVRAKVGDSFSYGMTPYFLDVSSSHWAFSYIQKLKELGITTGYGDGTYRPENLITRAEMATFLSRTFLIPEVSATIGPSGGVIEVNDHSSPLFGIKLEIPASSLSEPTKLTINGVKGVVNIGPSGTIFHIPATLTIPYKETEHEDFLAVFTKYKKGEDWIIHENYIIDTLSNKAILNLSHLSEYGIYNLISPDEVEFYIKGGSEIAKATIKEVILNGPWKEFYNCMGKTIKEAHSESEANIIIEWDDLPLKVNAKTDFDCFNPTSPVFYWCTPKGIKVNENRYFHELLDKNIPADKVDLYGTIAHELGHIFGLKDYDNGQSNAVTDGHLLPGEYARGLQEIDKARLKEKYSRCRECHNIAGNWSYYNIGNVTCTFDGEVGMESISGEGIVSINQKYCDVSWFEPIYNVKRSGTITNESIQVSGIFALGLDCEFYFTQNHYDASGKIEENRISLTGSGIATGRFCCEGECYDFSCTATDSTTLTR